MHTILLYCYWTDDVEKKSFRFPTALISCATHIYCPLFVQTCLWTIPNAVCIISALSPALFLFAILLFLLYWPSHVHALVDLHTVLTLVTTKKKCTELPFACELGITLIVDWTSHKEP